MNVVEISYSRIDEYAGIPISFEGNSILDVKLVDQGLGGIQLIEHPVELFWKDYDLFSSPLTWKGEFKPDNWGIFLALDGDKPIGGAAVAWNTNDINMLEDRGNLSVLWDLRILPERRRTGIGRVLFETTANWSKRRGCVQMKIETQNINVNACRFYAAMGAELGDIRRYAYWHEPFAKQETQLNWYYSISK